ncbi:FUSC family protein [Gaetbulibacter aestuarii]|uniref:FUSC family protein n=1 Tax=Gaetbulibacter aestuarii TaxID=1502358 RepID=A0ABW7MZ69_9FLAO
MKKLFTILALIAAILAIILAVLPVSNLAVIPSIAALIFGVLAFYFSKKSGEVKKLVQFSFLLTTAALVLVVYKALFTETEVSSTETLDAKETQFKEEAIDELEELDIDNIDEIDGIELDDSIEDIELN